MHVLRRIGFAGLLAVWLCVPAACAGPGRAQTPATPTGSAPSTRVVPISIGSTDPDQVAATDACLITDSGQRLVSSLGFKGIRAAAKVTPARDLPRYVPLWGTEPEIRTDAPAWVFQFEGVVTIPIDIVERDPLCVVVEGQASWFSVGASYVDGAWIEARRPPGGGPGETLPPVRP